jgi:hypothetical protein
MGLRHAAGKGVREIRLGIFRAPLTHLFLERICFPARRNPLADRGPPRSRASFSVAAVLAGSGIFAWLEPQKVFFGPSPDRLSPYR